MKRGDIVLLELGTENILGSEHRGKKYGVVISNNIGNKYAPTAIVLIMTKKEPEQPTHACINWKGGSIILAEQIKTVSKKRIKCVVDKLSPEDMERVDKALAISIGFVPEYL